MSKPHHGFPSGYFKIRSRLTGKCLEIKDGGTNRATPIITNNCHDGHHQLWYADKLGRVVSRLNGMALDIKGVNKANGATLHTWNTHGMKNQQWYVDSIGRIVSRLNQKSLSFDENNKGATPAYMWESINGPAQKWYFEKAQDSDRTVSLKKRYSGTQGVQKVPGDKILPAAGFTYQFWMKLDKFEGGKWKAIFSKSKDHANAKNRAPGIWIYPNELRFHLKTNTTKDWNEGIPNDPVYDIPLRKWINVAFTINGNRMEFYVDGNRTSTGKLKGHFNPNNSHLWIGHDNKSIHVRDLEYTNYVLNPEQIAKNMRSTDPRLADKPKKAIQGQGPTEDIPDLGVRITKFISNGSKSACPPHRARLGTGRSWCAKDETGNQYLEAVLDKEYHVKAIMTQGRSDANQWTKSYAIKYLSNGKWKSAGDTFKGNTDRHTIKTNKVDFNAQKVRFYPLTWNNWPSVRLGFDGVPLSQSKCARYKDQSVNGSTEMIRKANLDSYNQECRTISYYKHLEGLKKEQVKYEKLYELLNTTKKRNKDSVTAVKKIKEEMKAVQAKLKRTTLDLELAKAKKCPPMRQCLPVVNPVTTTSVKKASVNDFDIRTHRDFHKYVSVANVRPCTASRPVSSPAPAPAAKAPLTRAQKCKRARDRRDAALGEETVAEAESEAQEEAKKIITAIAEAEQKISPKPKAPVQPIQPVQPVQPVVPKRKSPTCQSRFNVSDNIEMQGGGVYGKLCVLTGSNNDIPSLMKANRMVKATQLAERKAEEAKTAKKKAEAAKRAVEVQQAKRAEAARAAKAASPFKTDPYSIQRHKDFGKLMKDYMLKSRCAAPNFPIDDISKHPDYDSLMEEYAMRVPDTCPQTYMPCPVESLAQYEECQTIREDITQHPGYDDFMTEQTRLAGVVMNADGTVSESKVKTTAEVMKKIMESGTPEQKRAVLGSMEQHPDYGDYVHISRVHKMSKDMLDDAIKHGKLPVNCSEDITKHPGYKKLMEKYALRDSAVCPPVFRPCKPLKAYDITQHPDAKNYVRKSDLAKIKSKLMKLATKNEKSRAVIRQQQLALDKLRAQHQNVVDRYVPIGNHPDIHRYILKTQIPSLMDRECRQNFKNKK